MKNLEKKPFEECKIELIELGDDLLTVSGYYSVGPDGGNGEWHPGDDGTGM